MVGCIRADYMEKGLAPLIRLLRRHPARADATFRGLGRDPVDVGMMLDVDRDIACRTGLHCAPRVHEQLRTAVRGAVRLSLGPFNTDEEAATTIAGVRRSPASTGRRRPAEAQAISPASLRDAMRPGC